ncbi:hypothetical protein DY000_02049465 [Brassica cretica]|uniref:Cyclic nucleotide-binding domain-containing protein n=1 Tax=Brassica cretica TaxID=69181 RepID=A0ABQ7EPJ0_BRACR|nr:hypothetical protein DY000_02049465 [Brassica cretica]
MQRGEPPVADLIRIEASVLELRRVDFFRWLKKAPLFEIEETWESVKAEMEARVCRSSKSRRLTCGPSHNSPAREARYSASLPNAGSILPRIKLYRTRPAVQVQL